MKNVWYGSSCNQQWYNLARPWFWPFQLNYWSVTGPSILPASYICTDKLIIDQTMKLFISITTCHFPGITSNLIFLAVFQQGWLASKPQWAFLLGSYSPAFRLQACVAMLSFCVGSRNPNSGPTACQQANPPACVYLHFATKRGSKAKFQLKHWILP